MGRWRRTFGAWQVELTTRCPLNCRMCIRRGIPDWKVLDMPFSEYRRLSLFFRHAQTVVLSGWGEPLLYGNLIDAVHLAKAAGPEVGFVTSGTGLHREYAEALIEAGLDFIGFSFAGTSQETHSAIRTGSDYDSLCGSVRLFHEALSQTGKKKVRMHIVYLMLRDNISDLDRLPSLAKKLSIEDILLTNLIHITNPEQDRQRVFSCSSQEKPDIAMDELVAQAAALGIHLRIPALSPKPVAVCGENPLRNLYISADGNVSPCVYLHPPAGSAFTRIFCGNAYSSREVSFGSVFNEPIDAIWRHTSYQDFRKHFEQRQQHFSEKLPESEAPAPPEQCRTCHKMLGL